MKINKEYPISLALAVLQALFSVWVPLGFYLDFPRIPLRFPEPSLFLLGWVFLGVVAVFRVVKINPPRNPLALHKLHVALLTLFLPIALVVGFLYVAAMLPRELVAYAILALWFEYAFILSFMLLVSVYGHFFQLEYRETATISPFVARDLALRSVKHFQENNHVSGIKDLRIAYEMTASWLASIGYRCSAIEEAAKKLSVAHILKSPITCAPVLGHALTNIPDWRCVVLDVQHVLAPDVDWASTFQKTDSGGTRSVQIAIAIVAAVATFVAPFFSTYPAIGFFGLQVGLFCAAWFMLLPCFRYWSNVFYTAFHDFRSLVTMLHSSLLEILDP